MAKIVSRKRSKYKKRNENEKKKPRELTVEDKKALDCLSKNDINGFVLILNGSHVRWIGLIASKIFWFYKYQARDKAEDILNDVYLRFLSQKNSLYDRKDAAALSSWFSRVLINETIDLNRKWEIRKHLEARSLDEIFETKGEVVSEKQGKQEEYWERTWDTKRLLGIAFKVLSEEERSLLINKEVKGYTIVELAAATGLNQNTIKVKLFRARRKCLKALEKKGATTLP